MEFPTIPSIQIEKNLIVFVRVHMLRVVEML